MVEGLMGTTMTPFSISEMPAESRSECWLWRVDPIEGESITSWIARLAARNRIPRNAILGDVFRGTGEQAQDLDTIDPAGFSGQLALRTGQPVDVISRMSLWSRLPFLVAAHEQKRLIFNGDSRRHLPWVIPNGWQRPVYVMGRGGGTPYCPDCINEEPESFIHRNHRLAFFVVCPKHKVPLREDCPSCGKSVVTWSLSIPAGEHPGAFPLCWNCLNRDAGLTWNADQRRDVYERSAETEFIASILHFQGIARGAMDSNDVRVPQLGRMNAMQFFEGLRHALTAFNGLAYQGIDPRFSKPGKGIVQVRERHGNLRRLAFNFHPMSYRLKLSAWLSWLFERPLDRWPHLFRIALIPSQLPRHWRHPWESVDETGKTEFGYRITPGNLNARRKVGPEVFHRFFAVMDELGLPDGEVGRLLCGISDRTVQRWRMHPIMFVQHEPLRRMEQVARIWDGLIHMSGSRAHATAWLNSPNPNKTFRGRSPIKMLIETNNERRFEQLASMIGRPGA